MGQGRHQGYAVKKSSLLNEVRVFLRRFPAHARPTRRQPSHPAYPRGEARRLPRATQLNLVTGNSALVYDQAMPLLGV